MRDIEVGSDPAQAGDLHRPDADHPPVVCLLHGGFWSMPYGRGPLTPLADDLARRGIAAWNLSYRRLGAPGGGWPGTFSDVAAGVDHLAMLSAAGANLDLSRVAVIGHSAGGHLALWVAGRPRASGEPSGAPRVRIAAACGLAPISDLTQAHALGLGRGVVGALLGGSPREVPARYAAASPTALLPLGIPQLLVHGTADDEVPVDMTRGYVRQARDAGDPVELLELPGAGHFEHLDPEGESWIAVVAWLERVLRTRAPPPSP